jgi:hypothetical protein
MAELIQRLFTFIPQNALRLGGEQWSRKLGVSNDWSRIRIGFLCAVVPNATANIISNFNFGLCSGTTQAGASAFAQSAIGACMTGSMLASGWTLTYSPNASTNNPAFTTSGAGKLFRRTPYATSESASSLAAQGIALAGIGIPKRRTPIYMDITRNPGGQALATIAVYSTSTVQITFDCRLDHFQDGLDQFNAPVVNGQTLTTEINTTMPISDMLGALDSMFIMWQNSTFQLEIYAIGASVVRDMNYAPGSSGGSWESFVQYGTGTAPGSVLSQGSGFTSQAIINGTFFTQSNPGIQIGWAGTSAYWPYDSFETYGVGSVANGITLFQGSNWGGNGSIY